VDSPFSLVTTLDQRCNGSAIHLDFDDGLADPRPAAARKDPKKKSEKNVIRAARFEFELTARFLAWRISATSIRTKEIRGAFQKRSFQR
jgi:hypothetical protein